MSITAKALFTSICEICHELIHEDDEIVYLEDDEEWVHKKCADDHS